MAKKVSQIKHIENILANKFKDAAQCKLIEDKRNDVANPFYMERTIVAEHDVEYILYRFNPDEEEIFPFFNDATDLKKICDYILFAERGRSLYVLLIEMKLGMGSVHKQLDASELFIKYILDSAERIGSKIEDYHIRKVRICERKSKGKRTTKPKDLEYGLDSFLEYNTIRDFRIKELLM